MREFVVGHAGHRQRGVWQSRGYFLPKPAGELGQVHLGATRGLNLPAQSVRGAADPVRAAELAGNFRAAVQGLLEGIDMPAARQLVLATPVERDDRQRRRQISRRNGVSKLLELRR